MLGRSLKLELIYEVFALDELLGGYWVVTETRAQTVIVSLSVKLFLKKV